MPVIYDPACPPVIFDGLVPVFTTCRDCGTLMKVLDATVHNHPCCAKVETQLESLAQLWVSEIEAGQEALARDTEALMESLTTVELGSAAMGYAEAGWPVFPLAAKSKAPAISKAKGGKGFHDATNDVSRIQRWWERHPDHNIGLATGHRFDVIDIDTRDSSGNPSPLGVRSFMELLENGTIPEVHGVAVSARGGLHLYVKPTGRRCFPGIRPQIDYKALGGYVVAPPSMLTEPGQTYTWLVEPSPIIKEDK